MAHTQGQGYSLLVCCRCAVTANPKTCLVCGRSIEKVGQNSKVKTGAVQGAAQMHMLASVQLSPATDPRRCISYTTAHSHPLSVVHNVPRNPISIGHISPRAIRQVGSMAVKRKRAAAGLAAGLRNERHAAPPALLSRQRNPYGTPASSICSPATSAQYQLVWLRWFFLS